MGNYEYYYDDDDDDNMISDSELTDSEISIREFYFEFDEIRMTIISDFRDIQRGRTYNAVAMKQAFADAVNDLLGMVKDYGREVGDDEMLQKEMYEPLTLLLTEMKTYAESVQDDTANTDFPAADRKAFCDGVIQAVNIAKDNIKNAYEANGALHLMN